MIINRCLWLFLDHNFLLKSINLPLFDQVFDSSSNIFIFECRINSLLVIYLLIDALFIVVLSLLTVNVNLGELFRWQLPHEFNPNWKSNVESEAAGRGRWNPSDLVMDLLVLLADGNFDQVGIHDGQLFESMRKLRIFYWTYYVKGFVN